MDNSSFAGIVCSLGLRNVDEGSADGGRDDQVTLALPLKDLACCLCSPHYAIEIHGIVTAPGLLGVFQGLWRRVNVSDPPAKMQELNVPVHWRRHPSSLPPRRVDPGRNLWRYVQLLQRSRLVW